MAGAEKGVGNAFSLHQQPDPLNGCWLSLALLITSNPLKDIKQCDYPTPTTTASNDKAT
jgi:hypothetical protein